MTIRQIMTSKWDTMKTPTLIDLAILGCIAVALALFNRMTGSHGVLPDDIPHSDGLPLAIIRAGTPIENTILSGNVEYRGVKGGVTAGTDLAVVLLGSQVWVRPLAVIPAPCGYPADLFSAMQDSFHERRGLIDISASDVTVHGLNLYIDRSEFGVAVGDGVTIQGDGP